MTKIDARNPRKLAEAAAGRAVRVLEPSPPAVSEGPWFADDPTDLSDQPDAVSPTSAGTTTWSHLIAEQPSLSAFARDHWLAAYPPLPPLPPSYRPALEDYHRLAYGVLSNARKQANGKIGLRFTRGGFGTPFFGDDEQARVQGTLLIRQRGTEAASEPISTLTAAARFFDAPVNDDQAEHDTVALGDLDRPLQVSEAVGDFLGSWFGFAASVLEEARLLGTAPDDDVTPVQIWPGHFDPAIEIGDADSGRRATYAASPGDGGHDAPYLYVASWGEVDRNLAFWNGAGFNGASLPYDQIVDAEDPRTLALAFFSQGYDILHA